MSVIGDASNRGVPLLVLTDGDRWDLYLSVAAGDPTERKFESVAVQDKNAGDTAAVLDRFLHRECHEGRLQSNQAVFDAQEILRRRMEQNRAENELGSSWESLFEADAQGDCSLRVLLEDAVARRCGAKPADGDIDKFMSERLNEYRRSANRTGSSPIPKTPRAPTREAKGRKPAKRKRAPATKLAGFTLHGEKTAAKNSRETMVLLAGSLEAESRGTLQRVHDKTRQRKFPAVVRSSELPEGISQWYREIPGCGWHIYGNLSTDSVLSVMSMLTETAGLTWEQDVTALHSKT